MTPTVEQDDQIVLHHSRIEQGTRVLATFPPGCRVTLAGPARTGFAFGQWPDNTPLPPGGSEYHWGTRAATGRLVLLRGPDPRNFT